MEENVITTKNIKVILSYCNKWTAFVTVAIKV